MKKNYDWLPVDFSKKMFIETEKKDYVLKNKIENRKCALDKKTKQNKTGRKKLTKGESHSWKKKVS